jgi:hypothetical protein
VPPRDLDHLFVVTWGRSGSTLQIGLLNTLPGYLVRGGNRTRSTTSGGRPAQPTDLVCAAITSANHSKDRFGVRSSVS